MPSLHECRGTGAASSEARCAAAARSSVASWDRGRGHPPRGRSGRLQNVAIDDVAMGVRWGYQVPIHIVYWCSECCFLGIIYIYIGLLSYELKALSVCFMFFTGVIKLYLPGDCQFDKDNDDWLTNVFFGPYPIINHHNTQQGAPEIVSLG